MIQLLVQEKKNLLNWLRRFGSRFKTGFIVTDPDDEDDAIVFVNQTFTELTGYTFEEVHGMNLRFLQGEKTDLQLIEQIDRELRASKPVNKELLYYKKDGTPFWNEVVIQPVLNEGGTVLYNVSFILDITGRKKDETLLKLQETIFARINKGEELDTLLQEICNVAESFLPVGTVSAILFQDENKSWNVGAANSVPSSLLQKLTDPEYTKHDFIRKDPVIIESIQGKSEWSSKMEICLAHGFHANWTMPTRDIETKLNGVFVVFLRATGAPNQVQLKFMENLTELIRRTQVYYEQQEQYRKLAYTNPETGLPNIHAVVKKLKADLEMGRDCFVSVVEPDEYSNLVDLYGRGAADELFIQLARRIEKVEKGKAYFIGRFSSASLVLMNDFKRARDGQYYVKQLNEIVKEPFIISGQDIFLTLKVGISVSTDTIRDGEELLRRADVALSNAKQELGNSMSFYQDLINEEKIQEVFVFNELSKAIASDEIDVFLQPKVNLETSEIISFEALARWNSPTLGQVSPNNFIPVAENTGRIIELENNVLNKVMAWQQRRAQSGKKLYQVAVNISVEHFFHSSLLSTLNSLVDHYEIASNYLRLEITESIGLVDFTKAKGIFNELNAAGFELSIDDFGVGFSSLSYLPQLKVNELKIDRSFIAALDEGDTRVVVMSIIQLANNLKLSTVAEGIEEERHIKILLSLGCKIGQGFHYYEPMPLHEVDLLLETKK